MGSVKATGDAARAARALEILARAVLDDPGAFGGALARLARANDLASLVDEIALREAHDLALADFGGYRRWARTQQFGPFTAKVRADVVSRLEVRRGTAKAKPSLILVELRGDHPVWPDARRVSFTGIHAPVSYGRKQPAPRRVSLNREIASATPGLSLDGEAVVFRAVPRASTGALEAEAAVRAYSLAEHGDPRAIPVRVEYASRRANPPRRGALVEVAKRDGGYWYRNTLGHLVGPYRDRKRALGEGVLALAKALHPNAPPRDLAEIADALMNEDRSRPYARRFSDGWRVWHPERELFVGRGPGEPFATQREAEVRRRELAGEAALDDGPMFRRAMPAASTETSRGLFSGAAMPAQLGLFGARGNPSHGLSPLMGAPGEVVYYRELANGDVRVRTSHAGAGVSEREMTLAGARKHRERLLSLGYRPNPAKPRRAAKRTPSKRSR